MCFFNLLNNSTSTESVQLGLTGSPRELLADGKSVSGEVVQLGEPKTSTLSDDRFPSLSVESIDNLLET